jgi:hypothetical protein
MSSLRESGVWKGWPYPEHDNRKRKDGADDMEAVVKGGRNGKGRIADGR